MSFFLLANHFEQRIYVFPLNFYMCVQWFFMSLRYNLGRLAVSQRTCPHSGRKNVDVSILEDEVNFKQPLSDLGISDKQKKWEWELGGIEKNAVWKELKCLIGWGFASFPVHKLRTHCWPGQSCLHSSQVTLSVWSALYITAHMKTFFFTVGFGCRKILELIH